MDPHPVVLVLTLPKMIELVPIVACAMGFKGGSAGRQAQVRGKPDSSVGLKQSATAYQYLGWS